MPFFIFLVPAIAFLYFILLSGGANSRHPLSPTSNSAISRMPFQSPPVRTNDHFCSCTSQYYLKLSKDMDHILPYIWDILAFFLSTPGFLKPFKSFLSNVSLYLPQNLAQCGHSKKILIEWMNERMNNWANKLKVTEDGNDNINLKGVMVEKEECTVLLNRL